MYSIYIVHFSQGEGIRKKSTFCTLAKKLKIVDHPLVHIMIQHFKLAALH